MPIALVHLIVPNRDRHAAAEGPAAIPGVRRHDASTGAAR
jgi:hypothetical protein